MRADKIPTYSHTEEEVRRIVGFAVFSGFITGIIITTIFFYT